MPVLPALRRLRKEGQQGHVIFSYIGNLRPAWVTGDTVINNDNNNKSEREEGRERKREGEREKEE